MEDKLTMHGSQDGASARDRLIACAATIFAQRGYAATSVADIAVEADISKSTVFHHFASKQALYLAVIESAAQDFTQTLETVLDQSGPLEQRLRDFQSQHMAHILTNAWVTQLVLRELQKTDSEHSKHLIEDVLSRNFQRLVHFIEAGQQAGALTATIDPSVAALTIISSNVFFFQHRHVLKHLPGFSDHDNPQQYTEKVIDLLIHGLKEGDHPCD